MKFWRLFQDRTKGLRGWGTNGLFAVMLAADLIVVGILAVVILKGYADQRGKAILVSENLSRVLDQSLSGVVDKIDLVLLAVVDDVEEDLRSGKRNLSDEKTSIINRSRHIPELAGIIVSDRDGYIVNSTSELSSISPSISDRSHFKKLRENPDIGLVVSEPMFGRVFLVPIVVFSRAYHAPDGSFAGTVAASVALKSLLGLLSSVDVGPKGNASLWGEDMGLLARYSPQPVATPVTGSPSPALSALIAQRSGPTAFHASEDFDGVERAVFFRPVSGWPLYLLVGVAADDYLGEWRTLVVVLVGVAVLFVLASFAAFWGFSRMFGDLKNNEKRLRLVLEASQQGWFEVDLSSGNITHSDEYARILGFDPASFRRNLYDVPDDIHPDDRAPMQRALENCLRADSVLDVDYRHLTASGGWCWIRAVGRVVERDASGRPVRLLGTHVDISERKQSERMIQELAYFDSLTQLPNRRLLLDRIHQALAACNRTRCRGGILFIDLDNFKTLNDSLGHAQGDLLLQEVARRLTASVRESDTVSRLGGDEFVVMLEGLGEDEASAAAQISRIGEKIIASISRPYVLPSRDFHCTASIGVATFAPD